MKYNLIRQVQYLASVCIGNHSQYDYHKRKLNKHVRKYADTIKYMNGRICDSDYNSPWNKGPYDMWHELDFMFDDDDYFTD